MGALALSLSATAQNDYIVKTRGAKRAAAGVVVYADSVARPQAHDFVGENFPHLTMCDWYDGMKFMVMPEKYDMIVGTFCDATTGREVGSGKLRYHIMKYRGHTETPEGKSRVLFDCQDDGKSYYYEIPRGSFDEYCYGKLGVPTLAYLGDVDKAREKLLGKRLYTKTNVYRRDLSMTNESFEEVKVPVNQEVEVVAVGVGSRTFPVKIVVQDSKGNDFYQSVTISRTNSGVRDEEFLSRDFKRFTFDGSFELVDGNDIAEGEYAKYIGRKVYTRYATKMRNAKGETVNILRYSTFEIVRVRPTTGSNYVDMTVKSTRTGETFTKRMTFQNENVAGDIDGYKEDYYGYLFLEGSPDMKGISAAHRKLIEQGKVVKGFTKREVKLAIGNPDKNAGSSSGRTDWIYSNAGVIIKFGTNGRVVSIIKK